MKFFLATFVLAAVVFTSWADLTDEQTQKLNAYYKECIAQTGVDPDLVTKARQGEFTDDPKLKEQLLCASKKIGFANDAGELQKDVLIAKVGKAINDAALAEKLVDVCIVKKDTPQEAVFDTVKCYFEKTHISII